ncbi:MAG TPA: polyphosphate kinase 1 [Cryomorphaceae bacterium]|nr:polyphosphate kinase 1 [Cryomorphaceae bacterium]
MKLRARNSIIARDISWLLFNERVLQEALDPNNPIIERLRFLGIFSSNMDEFFRVRYASIKRLSQISETPKKRLGGQSPAELLTEISEKSMEMQVRAQEVNDQLLNELEEKGISFVNEKNLTAGQQDYVRKYFIDKVSAAVFTLLLTDKDRVPHLRDKSIYLAIKMMKKETPDKPEYALIEVPSDLVGRFVVLPKYGKQYVMYLEDLIRYNLEYILFIYDFDRIEAHTVKITRDAELDLDDDVSKGFLEKMSKSVKNRRTGDPVRFVYDKEISGDILQFLMQRMDLDSYDTLIPGGRYHNKKDYIKFPDLGMHEYEFDALPPMQHPDLDLDRSILNVVRKKDVLLFMPYHSFSYLIRMLRQAALDLLVQSIQVTLYRVADKSRMISALINAAKNGKQVTVVIELRARFDEEANIKWTQELQAEGVHVIFGVSGLKVHSKMFLITRKDGDKIERFASIGTGNYNESTSKLYTDYHLLTADKAITTEVESVFDFLQRNYKVNKYRHLFVSPHYTRKAFIRLIENEIENAKKGSPSGITLKLNSLCDVKIIEKLYEASSYGVKIRMIIRGICSLVPGVKGLSENIEAISILDRFLEHSRVMVFENGGDPKYFISSADWMPRNLDYRVEVTVPIFDDVIKRQLRDHLDIIWKDNVKSRWHNEEQDNAYRVIKGPKIRSQYALYDYVKNQLKRGR